MTLTESVVETAALDWFRKLGYHVVGGPDMPPGAGADVLSSTESVCP